MIQLLFVKTKVVINFNGTTTRVLPIFCGVKQGCPWAPYLFLVIGETLNQVVKTHVMSGNFVGISLFPCSRNDQLISQDVDDTSFTIKGKRNHMEILIAFLKVFGMALDLEIKPKKTHHIILE
jgi:hypothetical protein